MAWRQLWYLSAVLPALVLSPRGAAAQRPTSRHPAAHVTVSVAAQGHVLAGANVSGGGEVALTDAGGRATLRLAPGARRIVVWKMGFSVDTLALTLRAGEDTTAFATLVAVAEEEAPIIVSATRVQTRVEDQPERVEVLAPEDVNEKALTSPGNMTNLLVEMGGLHIQRVVPGLGGVNLRVQGLPGRYTLILSDGLPLYGGQVPSFSLAQMPPLDLRQVEVLKGATTALYGPSALGGVVDLISKSPAHARDLLVSQNTSGGTDALLWLSRRLSRRWGYTLLAGAHQQPRRDVNGDGWTDVAGYHRIEARPRLFWTAVNGSSLLLTAGGIAENREGGTLPGATLPGGGAFAQTLDTRHADAGAIGHFVVSPNVFVGARASIMTTRHTRTFGADVEHDRQGTLFAEGTVSLTEGRHQAVLGVSLQDDRFRQLERPVFDYDFTTASVFGEDTYTPVAALAIEASARLDQHSRYGTFFSPRLSALWHVAHDWSVRASGARGFFAPTPLTPDVEEAGFQHLLPLRGLTAEKGESASLEVNGSLGPFQLDGTLFDARISDPLLPRPVPAPGDSLAFELANAPGPLRAAGVELFAVYGRDPFLVTATYSHTVASEYSLEAGHRIAVPLTPLNAGGVDIAFEEEDPGEPGIRIATEIFYTGQQRLEEDPYRTFSPGYTTVELLVSKRFGRFLVFANGDDLTDVRQTRWDPLLLPAPGLGGRPTTDAWAPLEGRVANFGVRIQF